MKKCSKCKCEKTETEFFRSSSSRDGYTCWCKSCYKISQKKYHNTDEYKKASVKRSLKYLQNNKDVARAHKFIYYATLSGMMERPSIGDCGHTGKIEAHHYLGYEPKHLSDVIWLCSDCHKKVTSQVRLIRFAKKIMERKQEG